ncbi:hypothetical protein HU200_038842 [Digitaria exilis]|uniref:Uncharacterized protein n=1 Tax=Digitaria exilis TaxID=1010633 RepID=A0A835BBC0_9POAL|nr:hypothetical protein HU200_038842 [Digitaria exilis]
MAPRRTPPGASSPHAATHGRRPAAPLMPLSKVICISSLKLGHLSFPDQTEIAQAGSSDRDLADGARKVLALVIALGEAAAHVLLGMAAELEAQQRGPGRPSSRNAYPGSMAARLGLFGLFVVKARLIGSDRCGSAQFTRADENGPAENRPSSTPRPPAPAPSDLDRPSRSDGSQQKSAGIKETLGFHFLLPCPERAAITVAGEWREPPCAAATILPPVLKPQQPRLRPAMCAAAQRRHHRSFLAGDDAMRRHSRPLSFLFSPALATSTLPKIRRERAKIRWQQPPHAREPPRRSSRASSAAPRAPLVLHGGGGSQARDQEPHHDLLMSRLVGTEDGGHVHNITATRGRHDQYGPHVGALNGVLIVLQLVFATTVVVYLDDVFEKGYSLKGSSSAISLFSAATTCGKVFWQAFSPVTVNTGRGPEFEGVVLAVAHRALTRTSSARAVVATLLRRHLPNATNLAVTFLVLLAAVYLEGIQMLVPLQSRDKPELQLGRKTAPAAQPPRATGSRAAANRSGLRRSGSRLETPANRSGTSGSRSVLAVTARPRVVHCDRVSKEVREYFQRELERAKKLTAQRAQEKLRKEKAAAEGNYPGGDEAYDEEAELQRALNQSRAEEEFRRGVQQKGGAYEHGGGSGTRGEGTLQRMLRRATSARQTPRVTDYNLGSARGSTQPRIDTGSWTQKDEDDDEGDTPLPSNIVADKINPADLRKRKYHIAPSKVILKRQ